MGVNEALRATDIRDMNEGEIHVKLDGYRKELFNLRFQVATRQLKNTKRIGTVRRDIARVLTVVREREIEALYAAEIAELQALTTNL
jgi:large subunit ribosomal protein L29